MKRMSRMLVAWLALLASAASADPFATPLAGEDLDPAAYAEWCDGAEKPVATKAPARDVLWTSTSQPHWQGQEFGDSKRSGARHLRIGFQREIPVGSVLARGGGSVSVLKPGAAYPGDLHDESKWLSAERIVGRAAGVAEADRETYAVWSLPAVLTTRVIRFTHVADASDKTYAGWLGGAIVLAERFANVAPQAVVTPARNAQKAGRLTNEDNDRTWQAWDNWEENAPGAVVTPEHPELITLVWPRAVTLRGLNALWAGFGAAEVQAFAGAGDQHPVEAGSESWRTIRTFDRVDPQYPRQLGPNWMDFGDDVTTRAIRLRITRGPKSDHPHLKSKVEDGRRIWLGELLALAPLGSARLASAILPEPKRESHPPVAVKFTLKEAGLVTLVIEDEAGRRVRNLVSETPFPAGRNTAWWDGMDDLGRDPEAARHGVYHVPGQFVRPGTYRVRGLFHKDISLRYEFPVYTAGSPAWNTEDRTGAWLANHSPPCAALFVPADRAPGGKALVYLGSYVSEGTHGLAWVDLDGRKVGGVNWVGGNWTGAPFLAGDGGANAVTSVFAYAGSVWRTEKGRDAEAELRITALTPHGDQPVARHTWPLPAGSTGADADVEHEMGGMAARDGVIAVSLRRLSKILFIDARTGAVLRETPLGDPRGLAFDRSGKLLALSGNKLVGLAPSGAVEAPSEGPDSALEDPQRIAFDREGNLFISDHGRSHQVKVFSPGGRLLRAIGHAGEPKGGTYDPEHMNHPTGLAIDERQQLWVTETDQQPKRVSVWTLDGKFVKAFYGPAEYGGGGALDPQDPAQFHYNGMTFKLDWERGSFEPMNIYYRAEQAGLKLGFRNAPPQTAIYRNGKRYFTNCYNNNPTGGSGTSFLFAERDGVAVPCAGFGRAQQWDVLKEDAFKSRWPAGVTEKKDEWREPVCFAWSDLNADGLAQPEEVSMTKAAASGVTVMPDLSFVCARLGSNSVRFAAQRFTEAGVPVYDLERGEVVAGDVSGPKSSGGDQALVHPDGWTVVTLGVAPFSPYSLCGVFKGEAKWSYPSPWPGLHASHEAPTPEFPGELLGTTRLLGGFIEPRGGDAGPLWCVNGNFGPMYLFTADGLFVKTLFRDVRQGKPWQMPVAQRGMSLDEQSPHDENFWPSIAQTPEGKVFLYDGGHSSLVRVDGLDSIRRLPDHKIRITESDLKAAREWQLQTEAGRQKNAGQKRLVVAIRKEAPTPDGELGDWAGAEWAPIDQRGVKAWFNSNSKPYDVAAAAAVSADRLYVAFRTGEKDLLKNAGGVAHAPFKTGGALDLMIGADPKADPKRTKAAGGDLRLLVTIVKDKPLALLYRAVVPGTEDKARVPFSSPWRTIHFDRVDDVTAQLQFAAKDGTFEFSIPLATLGLLAESGVTLKGDLGVLRGSGSETTQRVYWSNKATGITADVPSEAELTPQLWGSFRFE